MFAAQIKILVKNTTPDPKNQKAKREVKKSMLKKIIQKACFKLVIYLVLKKHLI